MYKATFLIKDEHAKFVFKKFYKLRNTDFSQVGAHHYSDEHPVIFHDGVIYADFLHCGREKEDVKGYHTLERNVRLEKVDSAPEDGVILTEDNLDFYFDKLKV